jgi:ribosomal protein S11
VTLTGTGTVKLKAYQHGDSNWSAAVSITQTFTVNNLTPQTITFPQIASHTYGDLPFAAGGSASSSLPVSYMIVSGPAVVTGNIIVLQGAGTVTVTATQTGNSTYAAAPAVTQSFTVAKSAQTINFPQIPAHQLSDGSFTAVATASSGLPISYQIVSGPATVSGTVVTLTGTGTVQIKAYQHGDTNYAAAVSITQSFTVSNLAAQTITFPQIASHTFGDAPFAAGGSASSALPVSYQIVSGPATVSGTLVTLTGAGTVSIKATQAGNGSYSAATPVTQSFTVGVAAQTINFPQIPTHPLSDGSFTATATASSGLPVSFQIVSGPATVSGRTVTLTGAGTVKIKAYQHGDTNYAIATSITQSFTVTP